MFFCKITHMTLNFVISILYHISTSSKLSKCSVNWRSYFRTKYSHNENKIHIPYVKQTKSSIVFIYKTYYCIHFRVYFFFDKY